MSIRFATQAMGSKPDNIRYGYEWLTGDGIEDYTGGKLSRMSPAGASALLGNWTVETGKRFLEDVDVVEEKNNQAGRGISQWSHSRRGPYDIARQKAIDSGIDPNTMQFQLEYFADEYLGKHDPAPGKSLIGWTGALDKYGSSDNVKDAALGLRESYFRPTTPHDDRRIQNSQEIYDRMTSLDSGPAVPEQEPGIKEFNLTTIPAPVHTTQVTPTETPKFKTGRC